MASWRIMHYKKASVSLVLFYAIYYTVDTIFIQHDVQYSHTVVAVEVIVQYTCRHWRSHSVEVEFAECSHTLEKAFIFQHHKNQ